MHKLSVHRATIYWVLVVLIFFIPSVSGCGGSEIQGLENAGSTVDGSSVSKSLNSADKDKSPKQCLYSKVTYTLDNGKIITYQFDPDTLSAVTPSKSSSQDSSSSSTQETRSSGVTRQAYDGTVMGLGDSKAAYVTDKLVAVTNAYTFFPGAGIAEEYIVCPEPSVYPENNVPRQGVTVVPSIESGLGPITYTPTAPSFTGAVHIVANYILPDDPPKPWHESWDYVYLVGNPVPVLTQYYSEDGNVMGLQFTMGMGSDTENVVLPRTLGDWHFISNNNMAHSDDIINMRELSIKDPVTFLPVDSDPNKIKIQAEIEELSAGSWTANIARAEDVIVDPDTQNTTKIDLIWDPATKYLTGDWFNTSGILTVALSKGFSLTAREIAGSYMHTITAYEDTVKTFAMKSAGQEISKLTIENAKATPKEFVPPGMTTITATVTAKDFTPINLKWTLTIKNDKTGATAHTSKGATTQISVPWELSKVKNFPGYGNYTFDIKATCKDGAGNSYEAKVSEAIKVKPPVPELTEFTFSKTIHLLDEKGQKISPIYFKKQNNEIKENPVAIPLDCFPESENATVTKDTIPPPWTLKTKMKFTCPPESDKESKLLGPITVEHKITTPDGIVLASGIEVTFEKGGKETLKDVVLTMPRRVVQVVEHVNVLYRILPDGDWSLYTANPSRPIYIPLHDIPKKPVIDPPLNLMLLVCTLGTGASSDNEVRSILVENLYNNLRDCGYTYDPSKYHFNMKNKGNCSGGIK